MGFNQEYEIFFGLNKDQFLSFIEGDYVVHTPIPVFNSVPDLRSVKFKNNSLVFIADIKKVGFLKFERIEDCTLDKVVKLSPSNIKERILDVFMVDIEHFMVIGKHGNLTIYNSEGEVESEFSLKIDYFG